MTRRTFDRDASSDDIRETEAEVPPGKQCTLPSCERPATDSRRPGALCPGHLDATGSTTTDASGDRDADGDGDGGERPHDDERVVRERARFLARATDLDDDEAETLAWREAGYSHGGIAKQIASTEGTVADRLDRITARYGIWAVLSKQPAERGRTPLSPATPDEIAAFPEATQAEWRDLAAEHPDRAPEWFDDPDRDPTLRLDDARDRARGGRERAEDAVQGGVRE